MSQTYYAILTAVGEARLANAAALGTALQLTHMAVGDGNGATPQPSRTQTALVHENRRGPLNSLFVDPANASQIVAEHIIPEDVGGWWIREIGLYDTAGDLCAVANCPDTYKPVLASGSGRIQTIRMVLIVSNTSAVQLKIDPSVVLAPRSYVEQVMNAHAAAADPHPQYVTDADLAAHKTAVDPHPQYATDADIAAHAAAVDPHPQYLTSAEGDAKVAAAVAALVGASPSTLDTINELAAAMGNDPNFAVTMTNALAHKADKATSLAGYGIADAVPNTKSVNISGSNLNTFFKTGFYDGSNLTGTPAVVGNAWCYLQAQAHSDPLGLGNGWMLQQLVPLGDTGQTRRWVRRGSINGGAVVWESWVEQLLADAQGNVGVGVTPKSWGSMSPVIQMNAKSSIAADFNSTYYGTNWYQASSGYKRLGDGYALQYHQDASAGKHIWKVAANGDAESAVSFNTVMTLDAKTGLLNVVAGVQGGNSTTEATAGLARVATQAEVNAGADDATIVTPRKLRYGFGISLTPNGYIAFPWWLGGLILQWATGAQTGVGDQDQTIPYPLTFPNACLHLIVSTRASTINLSDAWFQERSSTSSNCVVVSQWNGGGTVSGGMTPRIFAIGY